MRRLLVLLSLVTMASIASFGVVACGGPEKPPLTPDTVEPMPESAEAGAPTPPPRPTQPLG